MVLGCFCWCVQGSVYVHVQVESTTLAVMQSFACTPSATLHYTCSQLSTLQSLTSQSYQCLPSRCALPQEQSTSTPGTDLQLQQDPVNRTVLSSGHYNHLCSVIQSIAMWHVHTVAQHTRTWPHSTWVLLPTAHNTQYTAWAMQAAHCCLHPTHKNWCTHVHSYPIQDQL